MSNALSKPRNNRKGIEFEAILLERLNIQQQYLQQHLQQHLQQDQNMIQLSESIKLTKQSNSNIMRTIITILMLDTTTVIGRFILITILALAYCNLTIMTYNFASSLFLS